MIIFLLKCRGNLCVFTGLAVMKKVNLERHYNTHPMLLPVWPSVGVINLQMALDREKVPHP